MSQWTDPVSLGSVNRDYDQGFADGCSESKRLNEHLVAAFTQGRAAGLEESDQDLHSIIQGIGDGEWEELAVALCEEEGHEPYELLWTREAVPEPWGNRWCKYEDDAKKMIAMVRKYSNLSPTSSARDAARWRMCLDLAHGHSEGDVDDLRVQVPYPLNRHLYKSTAEQFTVAIDAALSSLEVIGKGEKG